VRRFAHTSFEHQLTQSVRAVSRFLSPRNVSLQSSSAGLLEQPCKVDAYRVFSTSRCLLKKGGKASRDEKPASAKAGTSEDPFDFADLDGDIAQAIERLKTDLSKLRTGGRFNPEVVENLRVQPEKGNNQTTKLSDLAQIIPKGRQVQILVGEKDVCQIRLACLRSRANVIPQHVKPISSAIQASSLSLTPQPDPTGNNPLLLILNIPPPTAESRKASVNEATKAGDKASTSIRDARGKQQKKLRAQELSKSARPDDVKKAKGQMEKVVEKGQGDVKKVVDEKKRALESG